MTSESLSPQISIHNTHIPSLTPSGPSFNFQLTRFTSTLFIWVGSARPSSSGMESFGEAGDEGDEKNLAGEWAVAMPTRGNIPVTGTPIFRKGSSDSALPLAQRLARKYPGNQIHLSLSLSPTLTATGPSADPYASRTLLGMEKQLSKWLDTVLASDTPA